jgi:two-component system, OmpR family, catabolic regulation response regulator CreB
MPSGTIGYMPDILIVEDEAAIADTLVFALRAEGHDTVWLQRAREAVDHVRNQATDLVILDIGLPDISGLEACRQIREFSDVPVLFLTARADEVDRVVGLEIGADDYVVKPFSPREVVARVRAILKRGTRGGPEKVTTAADKTGALRVDASRRLIAYRNQPLSLTPHEYRLLERLVSRPEQVFSREQLLDVLGVSQEAGYERNIDGHIKDIRAKLRSIAPDAEAVQTHRGFGYSYQPSQS